MKMIFLIILVCLLFVIALVFFIRIILLKKQIRIFSEDVKTILDKDSREPLKLGTFDKDIVELAKNINLHVDRQREEYAKYVREKERFNYLVTGISHDFRTPLTSSLGYLQLLSKSGEIKERKVRDYLDIAIEKNLYLKELSDDFFEMSKLSLGEEKECKIEPFNLSGLVEEVLLQSYERFASNGIEPMLRITPDIIIDSDPHEVRRILENLLSNALKYADKKLEVSLRGKTLEFCNDVKDPDDFDVDHIFEPFYRGRARTKNGSGLGLYVVKYLSDELHIIISAEKKENFIVRLIFP